MPPLRDISHLLKIMTGGAGKIEYLPYIKYGTDSTNLLVASAASRWYSFWRMSGQPGHASTAPSTAVVPTNTTEGSLKQSTTGVNRQKYFVNISINSIINFTRGLFVLYDRLSHQGGLSGTTTGAQTTNLPTAALTRHTGSNSRGNMIFLEIYSVIGTTATTVTASYTNQNGTSGRTTRSVAFGGTGRRESHYMVYLPLQDDDTGVQSVESVTLAATTGTVGNFGVVIARQIIQIDVATNICQHSTLNSFNDQLPKIGSDACLAMMMLPEIAISGCAIFANITLIEA